jgi:leucyl-tRNA synthetase
VPEKDLPVTLPFLRDYQPDGQGLSPLRRDETFYRTTCPECGGPATRETDVSDNFLCSAWYF